MKYSFCLVTATLIAALSSIGCSAGKVPSSLAKGPSDGVSVDLAGGHCQVDPRDPMGYQMGFVTFFCATADEVDKPHLLSGERHGIVVIVRVPKASARQFMVEHPAPPHPADPSMSL